MRRFFSTLQSHFAQQSKMTSLSYADCTYVVTLVRNGKPFEMTFGEHKLSVHAARPNELSPFERSQIKGPVAADGNYYYIYAQHLDLGVGTFVWLESNDEATTLQRMLQEHNDAVNDGEYSAWSATCMA